MEKFTKLKKNKYYAVYNENNKCVGACLNKSDIDKFIRSNNRYTFIKKECYDFYDDGNYDCAESTEMLVFNISVEGKSQEISFMNSVGFSLCFLHLHYKYNSIGYIINDIIEYQYLYDNSFGEYKEYVINELISNLLDILNYKNICIISSLINTLLYYNLRTIEDLQEWEYDSTHYVIDNEIKEISIEKRKQFIDICIYDLLTIDGLNNHQTICDNIDKSITRTELVKNLTIRDLLENYDITYLYSFYKLLFEEEVVDPAIFIK